MSSAYHLATDGQTEVVNRCLETYLRCMCGVKDWNLWLPLAEWWYNTNFHTATGLTPYEIVYNQQPHYICLICLGKLLMLQRIEVWKKGN